MKPFNEPRGEEVLKHLKASFELDPNRKPMYKDGKKHKHYRISLSLEDPEPDIDLVVYRLDPTYYDPIRETDDSKSDFKVDITSYGDYPLTVKIKKGMDWIVQQVYLSDLLKKGHRDALNDPTVKEAIEYIEHH